VTGQIRIRLVAAASLAWLAFAGGAAAIPAQSPPSAAAKGRAVTTLYPIPDSRGLMVTTGGWAYCEQIRPIARATRYALLCGRYVEDGYLGPGLRSRRRLDWGDAAYLADLAAKARRLHDRIGGKLILIGVSYSGFGVATLASHHPELRPDRLVVVDSYLDLVARRSRLPDWHATAREIDTETGGSTASLRRRSVRVDGLARLVRQGTVLTAVWSVSEEERTFFAGATCDRDANAATLARLARALGRPVPARVTVTRHGHTLWHHGAAIVEGRVPGKLFLFEPDGVVPPGAVCAD
jgi:hypothetical protein